MKKNNCVICGVELTEQNRSKSYRYRCKQCVAQMVAEKRHEKKMHDLFAPKIDSVKFVEIAEDVQRFISHEAMRAGVKQDAVKEVIRKMNI